MADMVNLDDLDGIKERYDDVAIVSYINTKADVKSRSDVCVLLQCYEDSIGPTEQEYIFLAR